MRTRVKRLWEWGEEELWFLGAGCFLLLIPFSGLYGTDDFLAWDRFFCLLLCQNWELCSFGSMGLRVLLSIMIWVSELFALCEAHDSETLGSYRDIEAVYVRQG